MNPFDNHSNTHSAPTDLTRRAYALKRLKALRSALRGSA